VVKQRVTQKEQAPQVSVKMHQCLNHLAIIAKSSGSDAPNDKPHLTDPLENIRQLLLVAHLLLSVAGNTR